jgi:hypothetical protein
VLAADGAAAPRLDADGGTREAGPEAWAATLHARAAGGGAHARFYANDTGNGTYAGTWTLTRTGVRHVLRSYLAGKRTIFTARPV